MKKTYGKVKRRTLRQTLGRFGAIFAIVALGVGFLAGLLATTPDMRYSGDVFFDDTALFDIRILGTMGLSESNIAALRRHEKVEEVMPAYSADVLVRTPASDTLVTRVHSIPLGQAEQELPKNYLNRVVLTEGRMPVHRYECVVEQGDAYNNTLVQVGDTLEIAPDNKSVDDIFSNRTYTVVGTVQSAYYFSLEREPATVGNGAIALVLYVGEENFALDVYTDAFLTVRGAKELNALLPDYEALMDDTVLQLEDMADAQCAARLLEVKTEALKELTDAQIEYEDAKAEATEKLADAAAKLADGRKEIAEAQEKLAEAKLQIIGGQAELDAQKGKLPNIIAEKQAELSAAQNQLDVQKSQLLAQESAVQAAEAMLPALAQAVAVAQENLEAAMSAGADQATLDALTAVLATTQAQYQGVQAQIFAWQGGMQQVQQAQVQIHAGQTALTEAYSSALDQFAAADDALLTAHKDYAHGIQKLSDAQKELANGQSEYNTEKAKANTKLADAAQELDDAEQDLEALAAPEWYVLTRNSNVSYSSFHGNTQKVEAIAKVFPLFFFLVAALVALTTMTRMVEEERLQIGTLKALGYRKSTIMGKYVGYALLASVLGSAFGLAVGFWLFPTVIWNAYSMMYNLPKLYCQFNLRYAVLASSAAIACTLLATLNAAWTTLMETPASLMLPRAPKAGKRIFLERIGFVWRRLKFTHKVTARNLFRYKKRFFMTVVGIAGCTALLVTGFGLHDSISDIVNKQFGGVFRYNLIVSLKEDDSATQPALLSLLEDKALVKDLLAVHQEKSSNTYEKQTFNTTLFVVEDAARLDDFVLLQERVSGKKVAFDPQGVVLTEKMAERSKKLPRDSIVLANNDGRAATFTVTGVVENYVENYVYMSQALYEQNYGTTAPPNCFVASVADNTKEGRDALSEKLLAIEDVAALNFTEDIKDSFSNMMQKIDTIVMVLIFSAGLLAFVVLYNLTYINITERSKEIATIKVLGFYEKEVAAYVYRESLMLSLFGTLAGLLLGVLLHRFVIYNIEVDAVMFGRTIKAMSYVYSSALTLLFSSIVNWVMRKKLRNISMVESMKAPE